MSQTPFTIKFGNSSKKNKKNNKPPVAPAKCGEEARLYITRLFPFLWYLLSKAENECYKPACRYITVSIIMTLKHLGKKLHEAITVRYLSHESCKTFIFKKKTNKNHAFYSSGHQEVTENCSDEIHAIWMDQEGCNSISFGIDKMLKSITN